MVESTAKRVIVTGGNQGIGYALCKLLTTEHGCHVYMGSRNVERGNAAIEKLIKEDSRCDGKVELVQVDVSDPASIKTAAENLKAKLGDQKLYALVNNAGVIYSRKGIPKEEMIKTNVYGVKDMSEAFIPLIDPAEGRIVNLGSGAGAGYVSKLEDKE